MLHPNFVIVGALIQFFGSTGYLIDTLKGKVQPNRVSWFLWTLAPMIAVAAQFTQGVGINVLTTFIVGFVPLIILVASFINKKASWKITRFDMLCGLFSLVGLALWYVTKVGNIAILFSILADGLAAVPTLVKSWKYPETENDSIYWFGVINAFIGLLTISLWTFEYWAFPLYLLILNFILAAVIRFKLGRKFVVIASHTE